MLDAAMAFMRVQKQSSHLHPVLRGSPLPLSTFSLSIIRSKSGESFQLLFLCYFVQPVWRLLPFSIPLLRG